MNLLKGKYMGFSVMQFASVIVMGLALMTSPAAIADYYKGNDLIDWSRAYERIQAGNPQPGDAYPGGAFFGYVMGTADMFKRIGAACPPAGTKAKQLTAIVAKQLKEQPEQWGKDADQIVYAALQSSFPCGDKAGTGR